MIFLTAWHFHSNVASNVVIRQNNKIVADIPIDTDSVFYLKNGSEICNTIQIKDGCACVSQANCKDKICTNHRKINRSGESIICLPNKVVITVEGSEPNEIDGVAR